MKKEKWYISTLKRLIIGLVISVLTCICTGYIYSVFMVGTSINTIIDLIVGFMVFLITLVSFFASLFFIIMIISVIISNHEAKKSYMKNKEQIKALPSDFVNVHFKDFDNFRLSCFVDSEDITCFAKLDENGSVVYALQLNVEYETDDYETFLRHFDI